MISWINNDIYKIYFKVLFMLFKSTSSYGFSSDLQGFSVSTLYWFTVNYFKE